MKTSWTRSFAALIQPSIRQLGPLLVLVSLATNSFATPQRIVSLAPNLCQMVLDVLGGQNASLVGVTKNCLDPRAKGASRVGYFHNFNIETVLSLKPTLVLATTDGNRKSQVQRLQKLGVSVLVLESSDLDEIVDNYLKIGKAVGRVENGKRLTKRYASMLEELRSSEASGRRVLVQVGKDPLVVVGGSGFLHSAIGSIGFRNVYSGTKKNYPKPAIEDVLKKNPDIILVFEMTSDRSGGLASFWKRFSSLSAVQKSKILVFSNRVFLQPTGRLIEKLPELRDRVLANR